MNWLLQQPLVILVGIGVAELVLYFVLQQTGKKWVVLAMVGVALAGGGLVALERLIITPEEAIRATLRQIARDAEQGNVEAVVAHISRRDPQMQEQARTILKRVTLEEVKVKEVSDLVVRMDNQPQSASALVRVLAVGGIGNFQHQRTLREFDVDFVREDNTWKVRGFEDRGGNPLRN